MTTPTPDPGRQELADHIRTVLEAYKSGEDRHYLTQDDKWHAPRSPGRLYPLEIRALKDLVHSLND